MSTPLGSFSFDVSANVSAAQRALQQLVQQAQQAAQQVGRAFDGARIAPGRLRIDVSEAAKAEEAVNRVARTVKAVADRSTIVVRADVSEAQEGLGRLNERARAISNTRVNLTARLNNVREAEAAVERMAGALRNARSGETINLNVRAESVERADAAIRRLEADINRAKQAGARVNVNVQTNEQQRGFFGEAGRGFLQQATPGLATGAAAAVGVLAAQGVSRLAQAMGEATAAGVRYNASLETSSVQMRVFLGSAEASAEAMRRFQRIAEATPFSFREINESAASFAQVARGDINVLERYVELATRLAAVNPDAATGGGIGGATTALREALSGDFTSIVERFRVSRSEVQRLRELGLVGEELAAALVKAAGGSKQLSDALADTFEARAAKAGEILERLAGVATKPLFDALNEGLRRFNDTFDDAGPKLERLAHIFGVLATGAAAGLPLGLPAAGAGAAGVGLLTGAIPSTPPPSPGAGGPSAQEQGRQAAAEAHTRAINEANTKLVAQQLLVEKIKKELEAHQQLAREIEAAYARQLAPLEAQKRVLEEQQRALDARVRATDQKREAALPPVAVRAEAASAQVLLDQEKELTDIRHRRAELAESIARAEFEAANRVAEAQIRAAERALEATQRRAQAEREARQEALEALREEIRGRQEARAAALEALRDIIQARQEERREALDALREEIQARQEARREALDGLREQISERRRLYDEAREDRDEARRAAQEAFADQERLAERAHTAAQDRYRDQIEALRDQARAVEERVNRESAAQRELAAFDRAERARQRAFSVASAERSVLQARTGRERADALQRLNEVRAQATADARREELQARIERQRQEGDRRREQIQAKIAELERKAREEDRAYQRERDARREAFEAQQRAQQAADRAEEKAERERRRAEDAQVRAAEKADREATKREQAEIRAAEKADREQTKAENAALQAAERAARAADRADQERLRAAEKADREEERKAQREILAAQQKIADARNALADKKDAFEAVLDAAALARLREQAELERRQLEIREKLAAATNAVKLAEAASEAVFNQQATTDLERRMAALDGQIDAVKARQTAAIGEVNLLIQDAEVRLGAAKLAVDALEKRLQALRDAPVNAGWPLTPGDGGIPPEGGQLPGPLSGTGQAIRAAGTSTGNSFVTGFLEAVAGLPGKLAEFSGQIGKAFDLSVLIDPSVVGSPAWAVAETIRLVGEMTAGWSQALTNDTTAEQAMEEWGQRSRDKLVKEIWDAQSPSKVTTQLGQDVVQGFIEGLAAKEREIIDALEAPWIEVDQRFWPEVERKWKQAGADHAKAYDDGFKSYNLDDRIKREIDAVLRRVEQAEPGFKRSGRDAGIAFTEGFCDNLGLVACFERAMKRIEEVADDWGASAGRQFTRGFETTARNVGGGTTTGGTRWFNPYTGQVVTTSGPPPGPVPPWERAGVGGGTGAARPSPRALGGPMWPGTDYLVGEHGPELIRLRSAGAAIPHALTMSTLAGGGLASISSRGAVSVSVNQTIHAAPGMDPNALARVVTDQAVAAIIDVLDDAERRAPNPLPRILPGARR